jgi:hypothetical protein
MPKSKWLQSSFVKASTSDGLRHCDCRAKRQFLYRHFVSSNEGDADIHKQSKQIGNSALMIERHYSKLTATMADKRVEMYENRLKSGYLSRNICHFLNHGQTDDRLYCYIFRIKK